VKHVVGERHQSLLAVAYVAAHGFFGLLRVAGEDGVDDVAVFVERVPAEGMIGGELPRGTGLEVAGVVDEVGKGISDVAVGDEVLGWTDRRSAQAEYVANSPSQLIPKPPALDWFRAGSLFVVATTAVAAVRAVSLKPGDVVAISGAAGGVGSLAVQLARRTGARVIGIASDESAQFLRSVGVEPVAYLAECLRSHEDLATRPEHYLPWVYRARNGDADAPARSAQRAAEPEPSDRRLRDLAPEIREGDASRVPAPEQHLQLAIGREEEKEGSDGGEDFGGVIPFWSAGDAAAGVEEETGKQKDEWELHQLGMQIA